MSEIKSLQLIGSKSFGGAERWFQRYALELAKLGHPTEIGVRRGSELDGEHWADLKRHPLGMHTVWDPISKHEVIELIKQHQPQIVQTYMGRATRLTHLPKKSDTVHIARLGGYYKLAGYRHADAWIGNTKGICDYMVEAGYPSQRVFHIYNFAELPEAGPAPAGLKAELGIPEDAWVLMTPGRFVPFKGHRYLLDALAKLPKEIEGRPVWQVILGDGPLKEDLHQQAQQLNLNQRIIWTGWQLNPDPYYRLADLIVFPSTDAEPFGNVIIEAWGYNRPLVTSASMGAREVVVDGQDGLLFECENPTSLSTRIEQALKDQTLRRSMAECGFKRAQQEFGKQPIMQAYLELYRELLAKH
jgi:glycosyltransferase involved in cell wall biosynthesis